MAGHDGTRWGRCGSAIGTYLDGRPLILSSLPRCLILSSPYRNVPSTCCTFSLTLLVVPCTFRLLALVVVAVVIVITTTNAYHNPYRSPVWL